jgi:hypothetical protein
MECALAGLAAFRQCLLARARRAAIEWAAARAVLARSIRPRPAQKALPAAYHRAGECSSSAVPLFVSSSLCLLVPKASTVQAKGNKRHRGLADWLGRSPQPIRELGFLLPARLQAGNGGRGLLFRLCAGEALPCGFSVSVPK